MWITFKDINDQTNSTNQHEWQKIKEELECDSLNKIIETTYLENLLLKQFPSEFSGKSISNRLRLCW